MKNQGRKVLVIGGFGFRNYGDEAILLANLLTLKKRGDKAVILSPNPINTVQYHRLLVGNFHVVRRPKVPTSLQFFLHWFKSVFLGKGYIAKNVMWADRILNVSGGNLNSYDKDELYFKILIYLLAAKYEKPVEFGAQTLGPIEGKWHNYLLRNALKKVKKVHNRFFVRDSQSYRIADAWGLKPYRMGDDACSLIETYKNVNPAAIREWEVFPDRTLDIFTSPEKIRTENPGAVLIGLNIKGSTRIYGGDESQALKGFSSLANAIRSRIKKSFIYLIPTAANDYPLLLQIYRSLHKKEGVFLLPPGVSIEALMSMIGSMDINVGMRYHFCIFSRMYKVPIFGVYSGNYQRSKLYGLKLWNPAQESIFSLSNLSDSPEGFFRFMNIALGIKS